MIHGDLSADLLEALFAPRGALHDGAVIIRGETIVAAGALLPLAETTLQAERFGTRHRAALGITEQTDAVVVVVSEEIRPGSLVERARIRRNLDEAQLARAHHRAPAARAAAGGCDPRPASAAPVPAAVRCAALALGEPAAGRRASRPATSRATTRPARGRRGR